MDTCINVHIFWSKADKACVSNPFVCNEKSFRLQKVSANYLGSAPMQSGGGGGARTLPLVVSPNHELLAHVVRSRSSKVRKVIASEPNPTQSIGYEFPARDHPITYLAKYPINLLGRAYGGGRPSSTYLVSISNTDQKKCYIDFLCRNKALTVAPNTDTINYSQGHVPTMSNDVS